MTVLPIHLTELRMSKSRNPSGVNTKLANFRYVDPDRPGGLSSASRLDYLVRDEFAHDLPRLRKVVEAIRRNDPQPEVERELDNSDESALEDRVLLRSHKPREQNRTPVKKRIDRATAEHGGLTCEARELDFRATYGTLSDGFIECHHTVPVSELTPGRQTKVGDLALLCANCHRMHHRVKTVLNKWDHAPSSQRRFLLRAGLASDVGKIITDILERGNPTAEA